MEDTLLIGDKILMSKIDYGPVLPRSPFEIPWISILFYFNDNARERVFSNWWPYRRLAGINKISRDDLVIFKKDNDEELTIKRCVGIPGDTITIWKSSVKINGINYTSPIASKFKAEIYSKDNAALEKKFSQIDVISFIKKDSVFTALVDSIQFSELEELSFVDSLKNISYCNIQSKAAFPNDKMFDWTIDDFGPLYIPKGGEKILLDHNKFILYGKTINQFEGVMIYEAGSNYYLDGVQIHEYTFRQNYYFVLGDNKCSSSDSRYWGFVPEETIKGRAILTLFSVEDKIRWNRIFKIL